MKSIREIRKAKGLTLETLSKACGVSAKTILQYEHEPPKRPSRKVIEKLASGLDLTPEELMKSIMAASKGKGGEEPEATIELSEVHISKILGLLEKEIRDLQILMLDYAEVQEQHPGLGKAMDYIEQDINLLIEIKGFFA